MLELKINGEEASLPQDTEFDIVRENPIFNKSGDYSQDITLSLTYKANRAIFANARRINSKFEFTDLNAQLWDSGRLLMDGYETILQVEDDAAKIQLLANNSALDKIIDVDTKIRSLDLGSCTTKNVTDAIGLINLCYGDTYNGEPVKEAYPILFKEGFDDFGTDVETFNTVNWTNAGSGIEYSSDDNLRPQPYFLFILDKIFETIGLTISSNEIDVEKYKHLLIINGYDTIEYAKMLPNWTIEEFITEVEKFFNVIICLNTKDKTVDIVGIDAFYSDEGANVIDAEDMQDTYDVEIQDAESFQTNYLNCGYTLPSSEWWQVQNIDKDLLKECTIKEGGKYRDPYDSKALELYYNTNIDEYFIHYEPADYATQGGNAFFRLCNQFMDIVEDEDVDKTEMAIRPAQVCVALRTDDYGSFMFSAPAPVIYEQPDDTFSDRIRGEEAENAGDDMEVAFYLGRVPARDSGSGIIDYRTAPQCISTYWIQMENVYFAHSGKPTSWPYWDGFGPDITLSLRGKHGRIVQELNNNVKLDTTRLYKITFRSKSFLDPKKVFLIHNRKFYCKQLKYKAKASGVSDIVEGEFFAAK